MERKLDWFAAGAFMIFFIATALHELAPNLFEACRIGLRDLVQVVINFFVYTGVLENPTLVILGLTVPIFILTVTFVGRAGLLAKTQSEELQRLESKEFEDRIHSLQESIKENGHDTKALRKQVLELEALKAKSARNAKRIDTKYASLGLEHAVLRPSLALFLSYVFQKLISGSLSFGQDGLLLFLAIICLIYGLAKVATTLAVVEEILLRTDSDESKELRETLIDTFKAVFPASDTTEKSIKELKKTLLQIEKQKRPQPSIWFQEGMPIKLAANGDFKLAFSINLSEDGASEANNAFAFIITDPEIEVLPSANNAYSVNQQDKDYILPLGNTAFFEIGKIRRMIKCTRTVQIRTKKSGKYRLLYRVGCDNYAEKMKETTIIVG